MCTNTTAKDCTDITPGRRRYWLGPMCHQRPHTPAVNIHVHIYTTVAFNVCPFTSKWHLTVDAAMLIKSMPGTERRKPSDRRLCGLFIWPTCTIHHISSSDHAMMMNQSWCQKLKIFKRLVKVYSQRLLIHKHCSSEVQLYVCKETWYRLGIGLYTWRQSWG